MEAKIENFLLNLPEKKRIVAIHVRHLFLNTDKKLTEAIKWRNLTFVYKGNIAMVYSFKNTDYINLGFIKAVQLSDPKKLFEGTGKGMRHIKLFSEKDIPKMQLKKWIREAMILNNDKGEV